MTFSATCSKMPRCKAPEILRSKAYLDVRRNDEGLGQRRRWVFFSSPLESEGCPRIASRSVTLQRFAGREVFYASPRIAAEYDRHLTK